VSSLYLYGIDDSYMKVAGFKVKTGRPFMQSDYEKFRTVMILDGAASRTLFGEENPIGKEVEIKGTPFTVIGIAEDTNTFEPNIETVEDYYTYKQETNGVAYVPKAAWTIIYGYDEPENVIVKARTTDDMTKIGKKTADILNEYVSVKDGAIKYAAEDLLGQASQMQQLNSASSRQLIWIAGISLLVGGIGVMNIMLVSVTERTPEIGLKKAIGAKKGAILWQFLTEAGVLTSIGGILGVVGGIGAAYVIKRINGTPAAIDVGYSLLAVGFSMLIGLLFGFLPSVQAANLDPIVALRRE
jgi:putative ABC transport system permease protein